MGFWNRHEDIPEFEAEIDPQFAEDWTPEEEKAALEELWGGQRDLKTFDSHWSSILEGLKSSMYGGLSGRHNQNPFNLEDTLITCGRREKPYLLPLDQGVRWGEIEQNFSYRYLWKYGRDITRWYPGEPMSASDHVWDDDAMPYVLQQVHTKLDRGFTLRHGSVEHNSDGNLVVSPSINRAPVPLPEDILMFMMEKIQESGSTWLAISMNFMVGRFFRCFLQDNLESLGDFESRSGHSIDELGWDDFIDRRLKDFDPFEFAYEATRHLKGLILLRRL